MIAERKVEDLRSFWALKLHNLRIEYAIEALRGCRNYLEIGSGEGFCMRSIMHWSGGAFDYAEGFDMDPARVGTARSFWTNDDRIRYRVANAQEAFPYPDGVFDAVVILDVLEHVACPGFVIKEAKRVIKDRGIIFMVVPCEGDKNVLHARLRRAGWDGSQKYGGHIQAFKKHEITDLLNKENLRIDWIRYSAHWFGQFTDYLGFEIKKYSEAEQNNALSFWGKFKFYLIKKSVKSWMQKLSYLESKLLAAQPQFAMDLNIRCSKI